MPHQILHNRSVVNLSGNDVIPFLQGLITNDALLLEKGAPIYTALLSPQGKFLHDFLLIPQAESIWVDIDSSKADDLLKRLIMYKLRSNVVIVPYPEMKVLALWNDAKIPPSAIRDPRHPDLGYRAYGEMINDDRMNDDVMKDDGDYEQHRIALIIPDGVKDLIFDQSLPLEFGFEALHGVSFSKGCYVGQEVTARMKYRANVKRSLVRVRAEKTLPEIGALIMQNGAEVGRMLSRFGNSGLAHVKIEALENTTPLLCHDIILQAQFPEWLTRNEGGL